MACELVMMHRVMSSLFSGADRNLKLALAAAGSVVAAGLAYWAYAAWSKPQPAAKLEVAQAAVASSAALSAEASAAAQHKAAKEHVEVVDGDNKTVRIASRKEVRTQNLPHRSTYVYVINKK